MDSRNASHIQPPHHRHNAPLISLAMPDADLGYEIEVVNRALSIRFCTQQLSDADEFLKSPHLKSTTTVTVVLQPLWGQTETHVSNGVTLASLVHREYQGW